MAPLACDATALDRAGATVVDTGVSLGSVISVLTAALAGGAGMAGDDPVGAAFGHSYDQAAAKLIDAMAGARNGLCSIGDGVRVSAHNYALAEAMSDVSGRAAALPMPQVTGPLIVGSPPPAAVGAGSGAPAGWGWVAPYVGMIWPSGDSAKLRAAAAAWTTAGANFMAAETPAGGGTMAAIAAQQIPEGAAIDKALSDAANATTDIARQCQTIAAQLTGYAAEVEAVHAAILDLLSRICDPLTGIKEVWEFLTDEDEDEIKRIAEDIRTVVDNFAREARALAGQINATVSAAATAAADMGRWAGKEWDHFLHGTPVGRAVNQAGQFFKGVGQEGYGFAKGLWEFSPNRLQTDPVGYFRDLAGMVSGEAPLVGLGPDGGPGVAESWKALGKDVTHWDEWSTNPAEALGKTAFDGATLAVPGGPLSKLGKVGRDAADALKGLRKPPLPEVPEAPPVKGPAEPPATGPKPPEAGRPAPPAKPAPGPADGPLPHSPTESRPPVAEKPAAGEPPRPATPPAPGVRPVAPEPADRTPLPHQPPEPAPARLPAAPVGESGAPPGADLPSPPEPHPPTPPSVPIGEAPAEVPPDLGELPRGQEPGLRPPEVPGPYDGPVHPVDGEGPPSDPAPGEANPTPTDDSPSPNHEGDQLADSANQTPGHGEMPGRQTISGHGSYDPDNGLFVVPKGSSITTFAEHGSTITDSLGNLIETGGDTSGVYSKTFYAGESIPNYTIHPPDGLNILGSPLTVAKSTLISALIHEGMGDIDLAVCTYDPFNPSGKTYHLTGIYDRLNNKFTPYERSRP
ncbi:putative adhesin [Mycobacterium servetii]|uniref:Adhesin n=1 Tax=Mycobacterium servetii TaxID=3237418 RepID=A0ABV4C6L1_9MYCO